MTSFHLGDVVAIPRLPVKYESVVVVEIKLPTVSCEPVATSPLPEELETMMEFGENVPGRFDVDRHVAPMAKHPPVSDSPPLAP